jgi:hypothetical protein
MSHEWTKPAWDTLLGNPIAKTVLVLLVDQMNGEGCGFPSLDFIARKTEQNIRTVRRVLQVFMEIELVMKVKIHRNGKLIPGFQLNLALLGMDLREEYTKYFRAAQGKSSGSGLRDTEEKVSETLFAVSETVQTVSETAQTVSETAPPHPLKGRPLRDPLKAHSPHIPQSANALLVSPVVSESFVIKRAVESVMQGCGFTSNKLAPVIRKVLQRGADIGAEPATIALAMIEAWRKFMVQGDRLRFKWTAERFFGEGYWNKPDAWPWDQERLDALARAKF